MDKNNFNGIAGKLVDIKDKIEKDQVEYTYFLPSSLPDVTQLTLDPLLFKRANDANLAIGELKGLTKNIGNIKLFATSSLTKEAQVSSRIEGTIVSLTDIYTGERKKHDIFFEKIKEVRNFLKSIKSGIEIIEKQPIDKNLVNHMHYLLLNKVRGSDRLLGEYRKCQNWIGRKRDIFQAEFVPPHSMHVDELMNSMFDYMDRSDNMSRLIKIGIMHYYFETIHPYEDGNGRIGRALILLYLMKTKVIDEPILYLSPFFERNQEEYYELLMKTRKSGEYKSWLEFFLDGIKKMSIETSNKVKKLIDIYNESKRSLYEVRATTICYTLLDEFFENPYASVPQLQVKTNHNYPIISRGLKYLQKAGIIEELSLSQRNKMFRATKILNTIEEDN